MQHYLDIEGDTSASECNILRKFIFYIICYQLKEPLVSELICKKKNYTIVTEIKNVTGPMDRDLSGPN